MRLMMQRKKKVIKHRIPYPHGTGGKMTKDELLEEFDEKFERCVVCCPNNEAISGYVNGDINYKDYIAFLSYAIDETEKRMELDLLGHKASLAMLRESVGLSKDGESYHEVAEQFERLRLDEEETARELYRAHNRNRLGGNWDNEPEFIRKNFREDAKAICKFQDNKDA